MGFFGTVSFCTILSMLVCFGIAATVPETCPPGGLLVTPRVWGIVHGSLWIAASVLGFVLYLPCTETGWIVRKTTWVLLFLVIMAILTFFIIGGFLVFVYPRDCTKNGPVAISMMVTLGFESVLFMALTLMTNHQ